MPFKAIKFRITLGTRDYGLNKPVYIRTALPRVPKNLLFKKTCDGLYNLGHAKPLWPFNMKKSLSYHSRTFYYTVPQGSPTGLCNLILFNFSPFIFSSALEVFVPILFVFSLKIGFNTWIVSN